MLTGSGHCATVLFYELVGASLVIVGKERELETSRAWSAWVDCMGNRHAEGRKDNNSWEREKPIGAVVTSFAGAVCMGQSFA